MSPEPDFTVSDHGSLLIITPLNSEARSHLEEHISPEALWYAGGVVVEPRYIDTLCDRLIAEGFVVS